jgi:predicted nucleic acid-binding protein
MKIYLDTCALNRPTDDQTQQRIQQETIALAHVLDAVAEGQVHWIGSTALAAELGRNPNLQRRNDSLDLLSLATIVHPTAEAITRSHQLSTDGYGPFDALHLAIAEQTGVSALLTVDDRFVARAALRPSGTLPLVENPVDWLKRRTPWLIKH